MAQQGLDPTFGLQGTCTSHVSGFGGWPLGVVVGRDQRPTLICSAPAQPPPTANQPTVGRRLRAPSLDTPRVVSFPVDGRPFGTTRNSIRVFGPTPVSPFTPVRAVTSAGQIAVLGNVGRQALALLTFSAAPPTGGYARWRVAREVELAGLRRVNARNCGLGWLLGDPVVVAPAPPGTLLGEPSVLGPPPPAGPAPRLAIYDDAQEETVAVRVPASPSTLGTGLRNVRVGMRIGSVISDGDGLLVGLTWVRRGPGADVRETASVLRLGRSSGTWAPEPGFGAGGLWLASDDDGEITTADLLTLAPDGQLIAAGRARQAGTDSLFAAWIDPVSGQITGVGHAAHGLLPEPAAITTDGSGRVFVCGATRRLGRNPPNDPAEAVVVCLLPDAQPDPAFGVAGIARFRLNGGTYATAVHVTNTGTLLVASAHRWGSRSRGGNFHPCVSRLSSDGRVDGTFGLAGVCRHDGLGDVGLVALGTTGRLWSAGIQKTWQAQTARWLSSLTVSQLSTDGGLETGFGNDGPQHVAQQGSANHQLPFDDFDLLSLVPTAAGGAILGGPYTVLRAGNTVAEGGSWVARMTSAGRLDTGFGVGGIVSFPSRDLRLVAELADGSLQGVEVLGVTSATLRLNADGSTAAGFGPAGAKPITKSIITFPSTHEPNGEWFAPVVGTFTGSWSIGLVRCRSDGTIDPSFGAGASSPPPGCFIGTAAIRSWGARPLLNPQWEDEGWPHQTMRLGDGTLLTLWSVSWQEDVTTFPPNSVTVSWRTFGLVLLAWTAQGLPRPVPAWGANPARAIPNPLGAWVVGGNWLGWRFRCALLQPDGSVLVGLAGEDADAIPARNVPAVIRTSPYFCRLLPGSYDRDPVFGGGGFVSRRLPGDDQRILRPSGEDELISTGSRLVDYQIPAGLQPVGAGTVVAAAGCDTARHPFAGFFNTSPDLLADGSVGMVRLV